MCACSVTRISFTDKNGSGRIAPVTYRCAEHRDVQRKADAPAWQQRVASSIQKARKSPVLLIAQQGEGNDVSA